MESKKYIKCLIQDKKFIVFLCSNCTDNYNAFRMSHAILVTVCNYLLIGGSGETISFICVCSIVIAMIYWAYIHWFLYIKRQDKIDLASVSWVLYLNLLSLDIILHTLNNWGFCVCGNISKLIH